MSEAHATAMTGRRGSPLSRKNALPLFRIEIDI
jgi:hypothetical protein